MSEQPVELPTEAMCHGARGFIMGIDLGIRSWLAMEEHLDMGGYDCISYIRQKAKETPKAHITKWDVAHCIWQLMQRYQPLPTPVREVHGISLDGMKADWIWCYENPKEAAAEIEKLREASASWQCETAKLIKRESGLAIPEGVLAEIKRGSAAIVPTLKEEKDGYVWVMTSKGYTAQVKVSYVFPKTEIEDQGRYDRCIGLALVDAPYAYYALRVFLHPPSIKGFP